PNPRETLSPCEPETTFAIASGLPSVTQTCSRKKNLLQTLQLKMYFRNTIRATNAINGE
ncbi:unnamed protein product, partial [Cladocopium goreaui]